MMGREFASAAARWLHLPEMTEIDVALHRPVVGDGIAAVERDQPRLVAGGLRPGIDRAEVAVDEIDRRRRPLRVEW